MTDGNKLSAVYSEIDKLRLNASCASCGSFQLLVRRLDICGHVTCDVCLQKTANNQCPVCQIVYSDGYPTPDNNLRVLLEHINLLRIIDSPKENISTNALFAPSPPDDKRDSKGEISLHRTCRSGRLSSVDKLLRNGSDVNLQDFAGWTPLHEAVIAEHEPVVKSLLLYGALVNIPGPNYTTALHSAVQKQNVNLVKLLVEYGADLLCFDNTGKTPMDLCCDNEEIRMALCLSERRPSLYRVYNIPPPKVLCLNVSDEDIQRLRDSRATMLTVDNLLSSGDVGYVVLGNEKPDVMLLQAAMLQGSCIVRVEWINNFIIPELVLYPLDYLAKVPGYAIEAAAMNTFKQLPKLFDGLHFYFCHNNVQKIGGYKYTPANLRVLVQLGGGKVLLRLPTIYTEQQLIYPYHASKTSNLAATTHYIIYDESREHDIKKKYNSLEMKHKSARWLIQCINNFTIVP